MKSTEHWKDLSGRTTYAVAGNKLYTRNQHLLEKQKYCSTSFILSSVWSLGQVPLWFVNFQLAFSLLLIGRQQLSTWQPRSKQQIR